MKKIIQGIIIIIIISLSINSFPLSLRFLAKTTLKELRENMCSKTDLENFYKTTGPDFEYKLDGDFSDFNQYMEDIKKNTSNRKGFLQIGSNLSGTIGYFFLFLVIFILLLLWIPYGTCIFTKRCCWCKIPDCCLCCPRGFIFCCMGFCAFIIIISIFGYFQNKNMVNGIYGSGCSILVAIDHLLNGDNYLSTKQYWIGLNKLSAQLTTLNGTKIPISDIKDDIIKEEQKMFNDSFRNFSYDLEEESKTISKYKLKNPDPYNNTEIVPKYLNLYGPLKKKNTSLFFINQEMNQFIDTFGKNITNFLKNLNLSSIVNETQYNIETIIKHINNETIISKISKFTDFLDKIDHLSRKSMNILLIFNLICALLIVIFLFFSLKITKCTYVVSIFWVFIYLAMLGTFLLGGVLGFFGSMALDTSSILYGYSENVDEINNVESDNKYLASVCIKGNGSIMENQNISFSHNLTIIENARRIPFLIDDQINELGNYSPKSLENISQNFNEFLTSKYNISEIISPLNAVRKYIDSSLNYSFVSPSTPFFDKWEINKDECEEYKYFPNNAFGNLNEEKDKKCLIITEWKKENINERYKNIKGIDENKTNIFEEIVKYYDNIIQYINGNKEIIANISERCEVFKKYFHDMSLQEIPLLNAIKKNLSSITTKINDTFEGKSINDISNCKFFKRDFYKIIELMHDSFGKTFKNLSIYFNLISSSEIVITILVIFITSAFSNKKLLSKDIESIKLN